MVRMRSVSWMTILPYSGLTRPIRHFRKTDFPVPDGPSNTLISPRGIVKLMSRQIVVFPNDFVIPSMRISEPAAMSTLLSVAIDQPRGRNMDGPSQSPPGVN